MTSTATPFDASAFSAFNARSLSPEEVAATFVPPPNAFDALVSRDNSLLVGPRGSGKTTLLKMLHPSALASWEHELADEYRRRVDYPGVFIPTDMAWNAQILGEYTLDDGARSRLGMSAFTTHILTCLIDTIVYRLQADDRAFMSISLQYGDEHDLVEEVARGWGLEPALPTLVSLRAALSRRMGELGKARNQLLGEVLSPQEALNLPYIDMDPLPSVLLAIDSLGAMTGHTGERWALLFDELELAPPGLRDFLLAALRSADDRLLFKLSLTPYGPRGRGTGATAPLPGHDFAYIDLTHPRKGTGYQFAEMLLRGELARMRRIADPAELNPDAVLGTSPFDAADFDDDSQDLREAYGPDSEIIQAFKRLREKDPSFEEYLTKHEVDLDDLESLNAIQRAAHLRKIRNLVLVRDYFRTESRIRSRKTFELYTGSGGIFALSEGNPRQFIGLVRPLLGSLHNGEAFPIPLTDQADAIASAVSRYISLLHTVPARPSDRDLGDLTQVSLVAFLDVIGEYFRERLLRGDFMANPPMAFDVDDAVLPHMEYPLGQAWNAGAIVHVPPKGESDVFPDLRGSTFRLSYLLAPRYSLPPRLGHSINLSTILRAKKNHVFGQEQLF